VISDYKALEYFMTTKTLTARQARWAEVLSNFDFKIIYKPGSSNKADPLSRQEDDLAGQSAVKDQNRAQVLLKPENLDDRLLRDLARSGSPQVTLSPITLQAVWLIDHVLRNNRESPALAVERDLAAEQKAGWSLENGLLLHNGKLAITRDDNLHTRLIQEVYSQCSFAHPGRTKTLRLLKDRYYWPRMDDDIQRFLQNCATCRRTKVPRDKTPGLLQSLPIPDRPWQHIAVDFKSFPPDKYGNDTIVVFVDRGGKRPISIPC
jgi:hypothetical protein